MWGYGAGLLASLVMLVAGGDQFVIGIARIATVWRIRPSIVGALVGGLGASIPELIVAGVATSRGTPQLAVGSLIGSNIANICLALAVAALITPVRVDSISIRREIPLSVAGVVLFCLFLSGGLSPIEGLVMLAALAAAVMVMIANSTRGAPETEIEEEVKRFFGKEHRNHVLRESGRSFVALIAMIGGAELLVGCASGIAAHFGIGQGFVGLTLVGIGTSAPLIAIAIQASRRGNHDLVVGNVFGSSLFVALAGGALVALLGGGAAAAFGVVPVVTMAAVCIAAWAFMARGSALARWEAAVLVVAYAITLTLTAVGIGG
jgi:cation:H+ antiporter